MLGVLGERCDDEGATGSGSGEVAEGEDAGFGAAFEPHGRPGGGVELDAAVVEREHLAEGSEAWSLGELVEVAEGVADVDGGGVPFDGVDVAWFGSELDLREGDLAWRPWRWAAAAVRAS